MIHVLRSWEDIGRAIIALQPKGRFHSDPLKNWDLAQIGELVTLLPPSARILDAGCSASDCSLLRFLNRRGFRHPVGIDLSISFDDRIEQFRAMKSARTLKPPFLLVKGNILDTGLPSGSFDMAACLSVVEHEVDLRRFYGEMARILKPGGLLYVSTDYWPVKLDTTGLRHWGLAWTIFSKEEIDVMVDVALAAGFEIGDRNIPEAGEPIVKWSGKEYTFLSLTLRRRAQA
jgi:SAM-dependent methyltransferase